MTNFREKQIGEGGFGQVKRVSAKYEKEGYISFCTRKEYKDKQIAKYLTQISVDNYNLCNEKGLKVIPVYKLEKEGGKTIIMSDLRYNFNRKQKDQVGWIAVSMDNPNEIFQGKDYEVKDEDKFKIEELEFKKLVDSMFYEAVKAGSANISLSFDSFFILAKKKKDGMVLLDYVIGDYDAIRYQNLDIDYIKKINLDEVETNIESFIEKYVSEDKHKLFKILYDKKEKINQ